jgi:hypothetical protein
MPDKTAIVFDVPPAVQEAPQSGWVYRSSGDTASASPPGRTQTWARRADDLLAAPFSVPLCLILSLLSHTQRSSSSK